MTEMRNILFTIVLVYSITITYHMLHEQGYLDREVPPERGGWKESLQLQRRMDRKDKTIPEEVLSIDPTKTIAKEDIRFRYGNRDEDGKRKNRTRLCIFTYDDGGGKIKGKYVGMAMRNKMEYAKRHGYHFFFENKTLDLERSPPWNKILYIQMRMHEGCDLIFFMDADAFFTDPRTPLSTVFSGMESKDAIFSGDPIWPFNTGVFMVRNTPTAMILLTKAWGYTQYQRSHPWEQGALTDIYKKNLYGEKDRIAVLSQRASNSFCPDVWRLRGVGWDFDRTAWKEGDFVMHFCAMEPHEIASYIDRNLEYFT